MLQGYDGALHLTMGRVMELTMAASRLILSGVMERHPNLIVVMSHTGGALPYQAGRLYRRLVGMSGLVLDRDASLALETNRWDGTLFYQHWLAANILVEKDAVYLPPFWPIFRRGGTPLFGRAKAEQGLYMPGVQRRRTPISKCS